MDRRGFLKTFGLGAAGLSLPNPVRGGDQKDGNERLNVVLIMADDVAYDCFGCYGSTHFATPRLDKLAATGVRFSHCYSQPLCTPSRVKIMTGRSGVRNYIRFGTLDRAETTFGTMMKKAGYATAVAGKWQLHGGPEGSMPADCGFDTFCLWNFPRTTRSRYWKPSLSRDGKLAAIDGNSYGPDICTDFLIEFITKNKDRPFFAYYPMILVHAPYPPTPDSPDRRSRSSASNFRDMVAYMDKCVGRIVDAPDKLRLRDKTVVMFTTDNGTGRSLRYPYKGRQRKGQKAFPTDGGCHAPLIVNGPAVAGGRLCGDLVDFSDFMPTIAEIARAKLPDVTLDGRSFWPQCRGRKGNPRQWIYQYYYPKNLQAPRRYGRREIIWAQDHRYKLYANGRFYDVVADRSETRPIPPADESPAAQAARKKLQQALDSMPKKAQRIKPRPRRQIPRRKEGQEEEKGVKEIG